MRRHRWTHLQLSRLAAVTAAHPERQAQRPFALGNHARERQHAPSVAAQAIGMQFVLMLEEASQGAQVDHCPRLQSRQAQGMTL